MTAGSDHPPFLLEWASAFFHRHRWDNVFRGVAYFPENKRRVVKCTGTMEKCRCGKLRIHPDKEGWRTVYVERSVWKSLLGKGEVNEKSDGCTSAELSGQLEGNRNG